MVLIIKDWPGFKEYMVSWGHLAEMVYRIEPVREQSTRIRIMGGRYGLDLSLQNDEPTLQEIKVFLDEHHAKRVQDVQELDRFMGPAR